jgi:hypothetical protein
MLRMVEIDIDADEKTAASYDVSAVPTLVLMTGRRKDCRAAKPATSTSRRC